MGRPIFRSEIGRRLRHAYDIAERLDRVRMLSFFTGIGRARYEEVRDRLANTFDAEVMLLTGSAHSSSVLLPISRGKIELAGQKARQNGVEADLVLNIGDMRGI